MSTNMNELVCVGVHVEKKNRLWPWIANRRLPWMILMIILIYNIKTVLDFSWQDQKLWSLLHALCDIQKTILNGLISAWDFITLPFHLLQLIALEKFGYFLPFWESQLSHCFGPWRHNMINLGISKEELRPLNSTGNPTYRPFFFFSFLFDTNC